MHIQKLTADGIRTHALQDLCELVRDAVSGGASVGWVAVPSMLEASAYWHSVADQVQSAEVVLGAKAPSQVIGTVQLHLSTRPNGAHRAEVVSLLVLDTRMGDPSQQFYEKIGYTLAGIIPNYARGTTGPWSQPRSCIKRSRMLSVTLPNRR